MKRLVLLTFAVISISSPAFAQPGSIAIFADTAGTSCVLYDDVIGLVEVYVFHIDTPGAIGSQFRIQQLPGFNMLTFPDTPVFAVTIGSSLDGVSIGYGQCLPGPISHPDIIIPRPWNVRSLFRVGGRTAPDSGSPRVTYGRLLGRDVGVAGGCDLAVNPDSSCLCDSVLCREPPPGGSPHD